MNIRRLDHRETGPRFSVIIPVFNGERYLRHAVESVLDQSYEAAEIVVVDDGSTDNTQALVNSLSSKIPLRYFYQTNQGPAVARNCGASLACGGWLAFLDADDVWRPGKLLIQAARIQDYPETAMFWCDFDCFDDAGRPTKRLKQKDPLRLHLFRSPIFPIPSTVVLRKEVFQSIGGFNPALRRSEDSELFMRIAAQFPTHFIREPLVRYRLHESQLSADVRNKAKLWPIVYESLSKICRGDPARLRALNDTASQTHSYFGKHFLRIGEIGEARRHFRLSFEHKPFRWSNLRRWLLSYLAPRREFHRQDTKTNRRSYPGRGSAGR